MTEGNDYEQYGFCKPYPKDVTVDFIALHKLIGIVAVCRNFMSRDGYSPHILEVIDKTLKPFDSVFREFYD